MKTAVPRLLPSSLLRLSLFALAGVFFLTVTWRNASAWQSTPPDGPGKAELQKLCVGCHELEKAFSTKQDRTGWEHTMEKMVATGMKCTDEEYKLVLEYLVKNYAAEEVPKVKVNQATAIDLESGLALKRSQARAVIEYREKNGPFKSIDDLKKVPGIEAEKIEAKKDRISFDQ